jgi:methanogenic corrinoid protein MtbC1
MARVSPTAEAEEPEAHATITRALSDTRALDPVALRATLTRAILKLGPLPALDAVISPFLDQVGVAWACAELSVAQEHLASAAVREILGWMMQTASPREKAPTLVATTIATELHEFGSMMAAVAAAISGWRVLYLGPNLPASEIARFARDADARAVALGIVMPQPTNVVRDEISALRRGLGKRTTVFAGGISAADHRLTLRRAAIEQIDSRAAFQQALEKF